jgi:hypothetical protein
MADSEVKLETAAMYVTASEAQRLQIYYYSSMELWHVPAISQRAKFKNSRPGVACNGYVTAVAAGLSQWLFLVYEPLGNGIISVRLLRSHYRTPNA